MQQLQRTHLLRVTPESTELPQEAAGLSLGHLGQFFRAVAQCEAYERLSYEGALDQAWLVMANHPEAARTVDKVILNMQGPAGDGDPTFASKADIEAARAVSSSSPHNSWEYGFRVVFQLKPSPA